MMPIISRAIRSSVVMRTVGRRAVLVALADPPAVMMKKEWDDQFHNRSGQSSMLIVRDFHRSAYMEMLARPPRRRRTMARARVTGLDENEDVDGEDDEEEESKRVGVLHQPVTDPMKFRTEGTALMERLYKALKPMEKYNETFILTRGEEEDHGEFLLLDLGPVAGQYTIQLDLEQGILVYQSPISGQVAYILSESTGEWVGQDDGHALIGLLTRDLIRQCNGFPNL